MNTMTKSNELKKRLGRIVLTAILTIAITVSWTVPASAEEETVNDDTNTQAVAQDQSDAVTENTDSKASDAKQNVPAPVVKNGLKKENGKYYIYVSNVIQKNGWIQYGTSWYYANKDGSLQTNRFITVNKKKYYLGANGAVKTGVFQVGGKYYYGSLSPKPTSGIKVLSASSSVNPHGAVHTNGWFTEGGQKYKADASGSLLRNSWITLNKKRHFMGANCAMVKNQTKVIGGIPYKFSTSGAMIVQKGWGTYNGQMYYKDGKTGMPVKNKYLKRNGKTYYAGSSGKMYSGWKTVGHKYVYFSPNSYNMNTIVKYAPFDKNWKYNGSKLTRSKGINRGPSGKESYYNMRMGGVVSIMRAQGFSANKFPYHVRKDGVKMLGPYVMVAANLGVHPRGTVVKTSLGLGLVCDTGGFAWYNPTQVDIAVSW